MFMNMERLGLCGSDILVRPAPQGTSDIASFQTATLEDRWILSRFNTVAKSVNESLTVYRFDEAANSIYDFFWGEFCDWYIELIKPRLARESADSVIACRNLVSLFESSLRLLHPVMPFITDELWHAIYDGEPPHKSLALAAYPQADEQQIDRAAETQMASLQDLIVSVRNLRAELKVEPKLKTPIEVFTQEQEIRTLLEENRGAILNDRQANVETLTFAEASLAQVSNVRHTARFDVRIIYEQQIDIAAEREKTVKELDKIDKELASIDRQLGNEGFVTKAPSHVVEKLRNRKAELEILIVKLKQKLTELR
jgi:valyl-tRNA synthetase